MSKVSVPKISIREIDPNSIEEISLVANRMRQTLVEVLGEEKGTALYSMEWLLERVRWHLDSEQTSAKIFLIEEYSKIVGHAIARIEKDGCTSAYGYFSTIFVEPKSRNKGVANSLVLHVETWLKQMKIPKIVYNTAENHLKLIRLFERNGFKITAKDKEMVQLTKLL
ncbi:MAG: hypothetical protein B7Y39_17470 [Bdellovibrio sp. 28-41-41]|nr:MAG: hypothetical protein B7Y39_17470 [Bdellovibrio sp. 28-41-41]